jgi:hypothetical protein
MRIKLSIILASILLLSVTAHAQEYRFGVQRNVSWLVVNPDGQADLFYELTFFCELGAHPIDIVDIGMPNASYQLESAAARVGEDPVMDIRVSEIVKPYGVEVHLEQKTINPGDSGTLFFNIHLNHILYTDNLDKSFASFEFSPTWYGAKYVMGSTYLECNFMFPQGVKTEQPLYHDKQFTTAWFDTIEKRVIYRWVMENAQPDKQYTFGASFPAKFVDKSSIKKPTPVWQKFIRGIGLLIAGIFRFFLSTMVFWLFAIIVFFGVRQNKKRRMKYLPPEVSVEGVGIKRGLTAPEAGIILEMPLDKVITMIMFGLIKKEIIEVTEREPTVKIKALNAIAATLDYEKGFIEALGENGSPITSKLKTMTVKFIKDVNDKMKGFSRKDTADYYRGIISQAWKQVEEAKTPELKSLPLEDQFDWMMMDNDYNNRMNQNYGLGDVFLPRWWGRSGYGYHTGGGGTTLGKTSGGSLDMPKLPGADFANKVTNGLEGFSAGLVGKLDSFTGGVTDKTNPVPVSSGGGHSSGGSGCACACACAGCACACAGGGR